ncbi:MAG: dihydrofolate reductase [Acidobacteriota bacterium]|nr:dihydrofolate reductase [Acidobacteriota bacterium]
MKLIAIAVVAANGVIGDGADQPFKFPEDWARFKRVTMGHPMIMGRRTHDAMGLLPGRTSIVVTRSPDLVTFSPDADGQLRGVAVASIDQALDVASQLDDVVYVIGGGQIYHQMLPLVDELDITEVHADAEGGVLFPDIDPQIWIEVEREPHGAFDFVRYERDARLG